MAEWISVKDKLPDESKAYICACLYPRQGIGLKKCALLNWMSYQRSWDLPEEYKYLIVTHWMELPDLPESEKEKTE